MAAILRTDERERSLLLRRRRGKRGSSLDKVPQQSRQAICATLEKQPFWR
jgi:hypothetical protein